MLDLPHTKVEPANPTYAYVSAFVDELQRCNVRNMVICPGSRSTPLAMAMAERTDLRIWMHIDERSAAFFALGLAKRSGQTVALLCTSGTAAANFLPAIAEAMLTHVPLLVLTADRPAELRENGAPQAIDQNRLYGPHVKWYAEAALPEASNEALRYIRTLACRASALTQRLPTGPVHLNFPFREPLVPAPLARQPLPPPEQRDPVAWYGRPDHQPYVSVTNGVSALLSTASVQHLIDLITDAPRGLIVVGPQSNSRLAEPLVQLAREVGYPLLADPLSQLRANDSEQIIASYDAFLRLDDFVGQTEPQLVLRFGAMPTAKPLLLYLQRYPSCRQIVIDEQGSWNEPTQLASEIVYCDPAALCLQLQGQISRTNQHWWQIWKHTDQITRRALQTAIAHFEPLFEGRIFTELATLLPANTTLYVGNSMPVRDLDTFFWQSARSIQVMGNRGANGIDGIVSSALGASAADSDQATVLVIGDLSFFHDLNGLLAAKLHHLNLIVVLVNNDGGGIFSFLPQSAYSEHFEQLFGTPTGLDFGPVVQMYGGKFQRIASWEEFCQAVEAGRTEGGLHVIEIPTERTSNVQMHRELWRAVEKALHEQ